MWKSLQTKNVSVAEFEKLSEYKDLEIDIESYGIWKLWQSLLWLRP